MENKNSIEKIFGFTYEKKGRFAIKEISENIKTEFKKRADEYIQWARERKKGLSEKDQLKFFLLERYFEKLKFNFDSKDWRSYKWNKKTRFLGLKPDTLVKMHQNHEIVLAMQRDPTSNILAIDIDFHTNAVHPEERENLFLAGTQNINMIYPGSLLFAEGRKNPEGAFSGFHLYLKFRKGCPINNTVIFEKIQALFPVTIEIPNILRLPFSKDYNTYYLPKIKGLYGDYDLALFNGSIEDVLKNLDLNFDRAPPHGTKVKKGFVIPYSTKINSAIKNKNLSIDLPEIIRAGERHEKSKAAAHYMITYNTTRKMKFTKEDFVRYIFSINHSSYDLSHNPEKAEKNLKKLWERMEKTFNPSRATQMTNGRLIFNKNPGNHIATAKELIPLANRPNKISLDYSSYHRILRAMVSHYMDMGGINIPSKLTKNQKRFISQSFILLLDLIDMAYYRQVIKEYKYEQKKYDSLNNGIPIPVELLKALSSKKTGNLYRKMMFLRSIGLVSPIGIKSKKGLLQYYNYVGKRFATHYTINILPLLSEKENQEIKNLFSRHYESMNKNKSSKMTRQNIKVFFPIFGNKIKNRGMLDNFTKKLLESILIDLPERNLTIRNNVESKNIIKDGKFKSSKKESCLRDAHRSTSAEPLPQIYMFSERTQDQRAFEQDPGG